MYQMIIDCPPNYTDVIPNSPYCYGFVTLYEETFDEAKKVCKRDNAQLILIKNAEENRLIAEFLSNRDVCGESEMWIGYQYFLMSKLYCNLKVKDLQS